MIELDKFDLQILHILQKNNKITLQTLSKMVNLSVPPCQKRIQNLRDYGIITRDTILIDFAKIQSHMVVFSHLRLNKHTKQILSDIIDTITKIDNIIEVHNISGDYDFIIKMIVQDMEHYSQTIFSISKKHPEIMNIKSEFVLKRHKEIPQISVAHMDMS